MPALYDVLIVGAGFAGSVIAEVLASRGRRVLVQERREHIGGNAYDERDRHGILVHRYGPHIFHTNAEAVIGYLSRFTDWRPYEHRVRAKRQGELFPMPINRDTLARFFSCDLPDEQAAEALLAGKREPIERIDNSRDAVLARVGPELYTAFFEQYTRKQWQLDPSELDAAVCARIPVRLDRDDRYFTDRFQQMPADGYTAMFEALLANDRITLQLGTDFDALRDRKLATVVVYTGPVDAYFNRCFGSLPYRSIRFEHEHLSDRARYQEVGTINEVDAAIPFTRTTEFKYLTGQEHDGTSIVREFPQAQGDPYYPVPNPANRARYARYRVLADDEHGVFFVGRLAQYRYYNMDQVVAAALTQAEKIDAALA